MNQIFEEIIKPYNGTESFGFGTKYREVKDRIKAEHLSFRQSERSNKGCEVDWPWVILNVEESITLVFVKDVLFEIVFSNAYKGKLPNGCCLGMNMAELEKLDNSLEYSDIENDYSSKEGYWVTEDDLGYIDSITIFVKEIEDSNFYKYEWIKKYL
ncbi:hypothetical protein SAMN02910370_01778 [Lachnospiraceae bacterium XPB1003]|nr:hypothetical protein SAMN02910370_01778 [Lachnospiraceae bacterium XPB1003]